LIDKIAGWFFIIIGIVTSWIIVVLAINFIFDRIQNTWQNRKWEKRRDYTVEELAIISNRCHDYPQVVETCKKIKEVLNDGYFYSAGSDAKFEHEIKQIAITERRNNGHWRR